MELSSHEIEMGLGMIKDVQLGDDRPTDKELRILMFTATYFVLDGVTLTIRRLESHLRANGAVVKILSTVPDDIDPKQTENVIRVPGIKIPFADAGTGYAFGVGLDENIVREIERFNPTCVHFTVPDFVALDGIRWCQRNNVAYIATWHSNYVDYLKYYFLEWVLGPAFHRYLKGFYEQIPAVFIPTPYMLKKMENEGFGSCTELKEWGRGVDLKIFTPERRSSAWRGSKNMSESDVVILWVGRLVPEKRPDIWLSVVKRLQLEGVAVKALVVGHGTFETSLAQLKNVSCCGWLSGVALAEAYACADVLLFPSDVETFGNVTLEALASGCACVVEDKCGGHLVEHGKNGFSCPAGDFEAFYQATKKIAVDAELRKQMGKYARESAWRFERTKIMQQMAENYKVCLLLFASCSRLTSCHSHTPVNPSSPPSHTHRTPLFDTATRASSSATCSSPRRLQDATSWPSSAATTGSLRPLQSPFSTRHTVSKILFTARQSACTTRAHG